MTPFDSPCDIPNPRGKRIGELHSPIVHHATTDSAHQLGCLVIPGSGAGDTIIGCRAGGLGGIAGWGGRPAGASPKWGYGSKKIWLPLPPSNSFPPMVCFHASWLFSSPFDTACFSGFFEVLCRSPGLWEGWRVYVSAIAFRITHVL